MRRKKHALKGRPSPLKGRTRKTKSFIQRGLEIADLVDACKPLM